jgi:hypothetical protein
MTRVLLVGLDPDTVDFSDPALPPGLNADKIRAGFEVMMRDMAARGWQAEHCLFRHEDATETVERRLAEANYDVVMIGGGVRAPPRNLALFERLINVIHRAAPNAAIAFNRTPEDSAEAVERVLAQ